MATFFNSYQLPAGGKFESYRLHSLALSAMLIRKWINPIQDQLVLVTDKEGQEFFDSIGVTSLYDGVVIPSDAEGVSPEHFFALIKLRGLREIPAPVYSIDWDLFVFKPELLDHARRAESVGLHYESREYPSYRGADKYLPYLEETPLLLGAPINCGIVGFRSASARRRYCDFVFKFMRRFSSAPLPEHNPKHTMMFAEQALLGHLQGELRTKPLFSYGTSGPFDDGSCHHIWGNKFSLDESVHERTAHCRWTRHVMNKFGMDVPSFLDSEVAKSLAE